jgi:hypothetical protein
MLPASPYDLRFDLQKINLACFLTRCKAGINTPINSAIMAITTNSSISVNPVRLRVVTSFSLNLGPVQK